MKVPQPNTTDIHKLLRQASSSRDPTALPALLSSHPLTLPDLERPSSDGKNALHMACWMGHLDNVSLLLRRGCDVNGISVGKHNYGKTPIFYAVTRGRGHVVRYLLHRDARSEGDTQCEKTGRVNVKIVNNKGQSVYSLAYSHRLDCDILECIRAREEEPQFEWIDYSSSHSDGCTYGDLDARFLRRPRTDDDVLEDGIVVNPTTRESRRGNFARNNPSSVRGASPDEGVQRDAVVEKANRGERRKERKRRTMQLSEQQSLHLEQLWNAVAISLQRGDSWDLFSSLIAIVQYWEGTNVYSPWIADSSCRLDFWIKFEEAKVDVLPFIRGVNLNGANDCDCLVNANFKAVLTDAAAYCGSGDRHATLVKRILVKTMEGSCSPINERRKDVNESLSNMQQDQMALLWNEVKGAIKNRFLDEIVLTLIKLIILWDGRSNSNWMHDFANQLHATLDLNSLTLADDAMKEMLQNCEASSNRHVVLLRRLLNRSNEFVVNESLSIQPANERTARKPVKENKIKLPTHYNSFITSLQNEYATNSNRNSLPKWNVFMNPYLSSKTENRHLSLPEAPLFVDSSLYLSRLESKLRERNASFSSISDETAKEELISFNQLVAFDSEFFTADDGSTELATIQLSVLDDGIPCAWVVDLLPGKDRNLNTHKGYEENDSSYYSMACSMLRWLFLESGSHIIGFAPRHDLHILSSYLGQEISAASSTSKIWDLQLLAACKMADEVGGGDDEARRSVMSSLPGLKSCCSYFLSNSVSSGGSFGGSIGKDWPSWTLSKQEQCSNWRQRPLSADQLEYAGLDAAVLLVLLSELVRRY